MSCPAPRASQSSRIFPQLRTLQLVQAFSALTARIDTLIVDTSAGIAHSVLQFTQAAQHVLLVMCDEPASLTDAYALVKVLTPQSRRHPVLACSPTRSASPGEGAALFQQFQRVANRFLSMSRWNTSGKSPKTRT